jgi:hypothetical protein
MTLPRIARRAGTSRDLDADAQDRAIEGHVGASATMARTR